MIQPGCWIDPAGCGHLFPDEVLAELQRRHPEIGFDPCSKADYDLVVEAYLAILRARFPRAFAKTKFIRHDRGDAA